MGRKRINISLTEATYDYIAGQADLYGFHNPTEMACAMVMMCVKMMKGHADLPPMEESQEAEIAHEITQMFDEYANWEPQPEAGHAPVIRRPRKTKM